MGARKRGEVAGWTDWALAGSLAAICAAMAFAPIASESLVAEMVGLVSLPVLAFAAWGSGSKAGRFAVGGEQWRGRLAIALAMPVFALAISTVFATNREVAFFGLWGQRTGLVFWLLLWSFFVVTLWQRPRALRIGLGMVAALGALAGTLALVQAVGVVPTEWRVWSEEPAAWFESSLALSQVLVLALAALVAFLLTAREQAERLILGYGIVACLVGLLVSTARGGLLGLGVGAVFVGLAYLWRERPTGVTRAFAGVSALVAVGWGAALAVALGVFGSAAFERLQALGGGRAAVWRSALLTLAHHPILGRGPDGFSAVVDWMVGQTGSVGAATTFNAHGLIVGLGAAGGLLTLIAAAASLVMFARFVMPRLQRRPIDMASVVLLGGLLAWFVDVQTSWIDPAAALCVAVVGVALASRLTPPLFTPQRIMRLATPLLTLAVVALIAVSWRSATTELAWSAARFAPEGERAAALEHTLARSSDPTYVREAVDALWLVDRTAPWTTDEQRRLRTLVDRGQRDMTWHTSLAFSTLEAWDEAFPATHEQWSPYERFVRAAIESDPGSTLWPYLASVRARASGESDAATTWANEARRGRLLPPAESALDATAAAP